MRDIMRKRIESIFGIKNYVKDGNLISEVKMPRVKKENVRLEGGEKGFCVRADEGSRHYESCFYLGYRVDPSAARAELTRNLLIVKMPITNEAIHGWPIHLS